MAEDIRSYRGGSMGCPTFDIEAVARCAIKGPGCLRAGVQIIRYVVPTEYNIWTGETTLSRDSRKRAEAQDAAWQHAWRLIAGRGWVYTGDSWQCPNCKLQNKGG